MTRSFDMRLRMEEKVLLRDKVQNEMIARKNATLKRNNDAEEGLRHYEMVMTTPRSLERRRIIRKLAMGMRRQEDMYIICEWGCMEWVKVGFEQIDHQVRRCPKRILACTLGCPMKLSVLTHSPTHSLTHSFTYSLTHSLTYSRRKRIG